MPSMAVLIVVLGVLIVNVVVSIIVLSWFGGKFGLTHVSTKKVSEVVLLNILISGIISLLIGALCKYAHIFPLVLVISPVINYFIWHALLKRYFHSSPGQSLKIYICHLLIMLGAMLILVVPIRLYIFEPFTVNGNSMAPALKQSDYIFIKKYGNDYQRSDVIVYASTSEGGANFLGRIIGLPGETVELKNGEVYIGVGEAKEKLNEPYRNIAQTAANHPDETVALGDEEYYILRDNAASKKGEGKVARQEIKGEYWFTSPYRFPDIK